MKNFFKKLALVLALALVVTSITPTAFSVSAASKITLKSGKAAPSTVYVTKKYSLKVSGTKVKFFSSNKTVATVGMTGGVLTPKAPGTVTVTAKSTKTGKTVATKKFTVKQRATAVTPSQTELYMAVGDTATLTAAKTPATSTDVVKYLSSDKAVATVGLTGGKVTAVANGKATITVYSMATKATKAASKYNKTATVTVYVGTYLDTVKQVSTTKLELTFKTDVASVKTSDFKVVRDATGASLAVGTAAIDDTNKKVVTITTFEEMKDGNTYTVSYGDAKVQFTATDAKITQLEVTPLTVQYDTATEMKVLAKDANGVIVDEVAYGDSDTNIEFNISTTAGYFDGSKLTLYKIGDKATATATYHTYTYDENGLEKDVVKTGDVTITAVEQVAITLDAYNYHIAKYTDSVDFAKLTTRNTTLAVDDTDKAVFFKFVGSDGNEITNYDNYTVTSSNNDVLLIQQSLSSDVKTAAIQAVKTGDASILVKDAKGNVVKSLPVTIVAARKATNLILGSYSGSVSNAATANDTLDISVKVLDQYNEEMATEVEIADISVECTKVSVSTIDKATVTGDSYYTVADGKVTFNGSGLTPATYTYTIKSGSLSRPVTVTVVAPNTSATERYELILGATETDAVVASAEDVNKTVSIKVAHTYGGVVYDYVTDASIRVYNSSNVEVTEWYAAGLLTITRPNATNAAAVDKIPAGSYTVKMSYTPAGGTEKTATKGIVVKDSQSSVTAARQSQYIDIPAYASEDDLVAQTAAAAYKFVYEGTAYVPGTSLAGTDKVVIDSSLANSDAKAYANASGTYTSVSIKTITVYVNVDGVYVPSTVTIGETISFN